MPKISALGGMSSRGFGEFAQQTAANYIEDVFSTYLYTGNGTTQTINNGIDLSTKGGLSWTKSRNAATGHNFFDTARGAYKWLASDSTSAQVDYTSFGTGVTNFTTTGFTVSGGTGWGINTSADTYASWTFRKQPKFFDIVQYNGNGGTSQTINHNLGSTPGMMIIKRIDTNGYDWVVYHQSLGNSARLSLNLTSSTISGSGNWNNTSPTSTQFTVGNSSLLNASGGTYIAYLFAHNAGGFGADGSQNVISCGSFVGTGGVSTINVGYEPQWLLFKDASSGTSNWTIVDNMRGWGVSSSATQWLLPNTSGAETNANYPKPTATGFEHAISAGNTCIYVTIRRGPMRTPTSGTSVFVPSTNGYGVATTTNFPVDLYSAGWSSSNSGQTTWWDRLRGGYSLVTSSTGAQGTFDYTPYLTFANNTTFTQTADSNSNRSWFFRRAPGFFDIVCYTGTGVATTQSHNLGVAPELMIFKSRNTSGTNWAVCVPQTSTNYLYSVLQLSNPASTRTYGPGGSPNFEELSAPPTSSVINLASSAELNASGRTFVTYLFASCPGVSKVGTYSGTGATQTISCGFTGGARYVLIKRTDSTGDWWVWDTARGMVAGTDPRLAYNSTAAETNANWVYTTTGGFQIVTSDATVNASGGTYIYLAIA